MCWDWRLLSGEPGTLRQMIWATCESEGAPKTVEMIKAAPKGWRGALDAEAEDDDYDAEAERMALEGYDGRNFEAEVRDLNQDWTEREIELFVDNWTGPQKGSLSKTLPKLQAKLSKLMPPKRRSRAVQWQNAASDAQQGIEELMELQADFEAWRDGMPDQLQTGPTFDKLEEVCNLDLQGALDAVTEAADVDLPMGFGQD